MAEDMKEGEVCLMCHGKGSYIVTLTGKRHKCCWCLGKGVIPSAKERRLEIEPRREV